MRHPFDTVRVVLAGLAGLVLVGPAAAGPTVPHKESCDGQLTQVIQPSPKGPGTMNFVGKGVATHMGSYSIIGGHNFTNDGQVLNGRFTSTAADGSTISGVYFGTFTPIGGTRVRFNVTAVYQTGTGRLAGVTGRGAVVAVLDLSTGLFHYDTLGTWTFP
jgi:hypothetical protein